MKRQLDPMRVTPPPPTVPRLMVTYSRNVFLSPISRVVGSPRYLRSCGTPPMDENGKKRLPLPIVVCPEITACEWTWLPGPIRTCAPITAYGPTSQDGSSCAPGSTTAVGWIAMMRSLLAARVLEDRRRRPAAFSGLDAVRQHGHE